jgi:hypothetical protein
MRKEPRLRTRTAEVLACLDAARRDLKDAVDTVPEAVRDRRLTGVDWSVGDVVEHLVLVEAPLERYLWGRWIEHALAGSLRGWWMVWWVAGIIVLVPLVRIVAGGTG